MSEIKKITYKSISNALSSKQLKNILGGSGGGGSVCIGLDRSECKECITCTDSYGVNGRCVWVGEGIGDGRCACLTISVG